MRLCESHLRLVAVALGATIAGCTSPRDRSSALPLSPERNATALQSRSLRDPELHHFLETTFGRDPGETWDFESLCWAAFYFNPSLAVARAQWGTARAAQRAAAQRPNPTLTLTPGYDFTHQAGITPWMPSVGLDFLWPTKRKRAWQQEIAAADADAARLAVYTALWRVRSDLRKALLDFDTAARRADLSRRQSDTQQRLLRLLEQRLNAGAIAQSDMAVTRTAWLRAEAVAADAAAQAAAARSRVAAVLGIPAAAVADVSFPALPPAPHWTEADLAIARRAALLSRADVLAALAKYRSANAALALELARKTPDVHLGPGYQYDQGLNKWSLGLTFEIPAFNRNEGPIAVATARRAEAAAQFHEVQANALAAIETAVAALRAAESQWQRARRIEDEAQAQRASVAQRLAAGGADQVELDLAEVDAEIGGATVLDAEAAMAVAAGQLEDALQVPFPNLVAVAEAAPKPNP